ncbi:hypothetical protein SADUNF_Sadunf11G0086300 [Salix dunnii]|uniref:Uncharacterized protein n=1 Tax=Salix dunnii TaxID=1413687 RepID=A0A835JQN1_9ROSI|nr:hypothetical protein SADUNF_Sadunf11G0086300 [Salix dunnii]
MWSSVLNVVLAWTKSSGWRRASNKRLIEQLQLHLAAQKHRRESIIRQSRADIAQLLQNDRLQQVLTRVHQLYKDQCQLAAYDQIHQSCECVITSMPHISQQLYRHIALFIPYFMTLWLNMLFHHSISFCSAWQCLPIDVGQAISNLIFAASRCGDLPELHMLRSLFKIRYGSRFETTNVELLPGNLVDSEMKENLVPGNVKLWLINRIAYEYNIHLGFQDFGHSFRPQWQENLQSFSNDKAKSVQKAEVLDLDIQDIFSDSDESSIPASKFRTPTKTKSLYNDLDRSSTDSLGRIQSKNKKNEVLIKNLVASATSISSYGSASPCSASNETKRPAKPTLGKKPVPHPLSNDHYRISVKGRSSLDSLIDECKAQSGSSSSSSHVHPKLPNYEDVVAKFTDIKAEYRHRRSFYY